MKPSTASTNKAAPAVIGCRALVAAIAAALSASAFGATHVAECHLSDGSKFVLRAKEKRSLLNFHPHGSEGPAPYWGIFYQPKGKFRETQAPGSLPFHGPDTPDCTTLGLVHGTPVVFFSFLDRKGKWFDSKRIPENVQQAAAYSTPGVEQLLEKHQLGSLYRQAFVAPVGTDIVYEAPLLTFPQGDQDGIVSAVMQSISRDGGATWSAPAISRKAFVYELGKSTLKQSFTAKRGAARHGS